MLTDDERNHLLSIADAVASLHAVDGLVRRDHCLAAAERLRAIAAPRVVASPPRPRCSCTHEAGDSRCDAHPTCSECGAASSRPVDGCEACCPLPKGG